MPVTYCLSMIAGQKTGCQYVISKEQGTIGRGPSNTIQVFDNEVSRVHCRFNIAGKFLEIADLDSSNGTYVNGSPVDRSELGDGDFLKVGSTVFELKITEACVGSAGVKQDPDTDFIIVEKELSDKSAGTSSHFTSDQNLFADGTVTDLSPDEEGDPSRQTVQISSDLNFMYHASLVTSSKAGRDEILNSLVDLIFEWVEADRCCVLLREEDQRKLEVKAIRSRGTQTSEDKLLISQSIVNYVRKNRVGILTSNATQDQRLTGEDSIKQIGIQEAICVPIQSRNELLGLIYIDALGSAENATTERFNRDHLKLMIAIGQQIGFAIENERYYSKLLQQQRLATIGQTTKSLSHHLKNVMQGVNGGSHLVEAGLQNNDMDLVKKGWEIVDRNQHEVSKLINDMLIIGQPYEAHMVEADLHEVITNVFEEIGPFLARRDIQYDWEPGPEPVLFRFDPRGIHWAVYNLINSSATACSGLTDGKIQVSVERSTNDLIVISITDNGQPSKMEDPEDLFSPTKTEPDQKTNPVELAVSRKLIRGHRGEVKISYPENGGNLFTVKLPLAPPTSSKSDTPMVVTKDS